MLSFANLFFGKPVHDLSRAVKKSHVGAKEVTSKRSSGEWRALDGAVVFSIESGECDEGSLDFPETGVVVLYRHGFGFWLECNQRIIQQTWQIPPGKEGIFLPMFEC